MATTKTKKPKKAPRRPLERIAMSALPEGKDAHGPAALELAEDLCMVLKRLAGLGFNDQRDVRDIIERIVARDMAGHSDVEVPHSVDAIIIGSLHDTDVFLAILANHLSSSGGPHDLNTVDDKWMERV